jgi:DNA invertase Pin-like site-specific DNA recombinase
MISKTSPASGPAFRTEETMTKAIIYERYSPRRIRENGNGEKIDPDSNEVQEEQIRAYCVRQGYEVDEPPEHDDAKGGKDDAEDPDPYVALTKRSGIMRALGRCRPGFVLVVMKRDRLARDPYIQAAVERILARKGARVESVLEPNGNDLGPKVTRAVLALMAEEERATIRLRTALAMQSKMARGLRMTRLDCIPYGQCVDPLDSRKVLDDPEEQETIRLAREIAAEKPAPTIHAICRRLEALGRTRRGKDWKNAHRIVARMIRARP